MLTPSPALPVTVKLWGTCQTTQISAVSTFSAKSSFCVWIGFISRPSSDGFPIWLPWNVGLGVGEGGHGVERKGPSEAPVTPWCAAFVRRRSGASLSPANRDFSVRLRLRVV